MNQRFTLADMLRCAIREVVMREKVYPRWVASGKMKAETAEREIACMQAIAAHLEAEYQWEKGEDNV